MIELYRGSINTWECDEMGHMNVRFYVARMMEGLASKGTEQKTIMIDATYLKAHRTASSLRAKKGGLTTSAGA